MSGCARGNSTGSLAAYCDVSDAILDAHVDSLIEDGGDKSVVTGDVYVTVRDKVCADARSKN